MPLSEVRVAVSRELETEVDFEYAPAATRHASHTLEWNMWRGRGGQTNTCKAPEQRGYGRYERYERYGGIRRQSAWMEGAKHSTQQAQHSTAQHKHDRRIRMLGSWMSSRFQQPNLVQSRTVLLYST